MGINDDYGTTQQIARWLDKHSFEVKHATGGDIKLILSKYR